MSSTTNAESASVPVFEICIAFGILLITAILVQTTGIFRSKTNTPNKNSFIEMAEATISTEENNMEEVTNNTTAEEAVDPATESSKSALQDNIERKGKNAYYYAHGKTANGPKWDGKAEPKLLHRESSSALSSSSQNQSFDYHKSNINSYAFLDEDSKIKIYVNLEGVGSKCSVENGDIDLDHTESTLQLTVKNYDEDKVRYLCFGKLYGKISSAKFRTKEDKIIITMSKLDDDIKEWKSVGASSA